METEHRLLFAGGGRRRSSIDPRLLEAFASGETLRGQSSQVTTPVGMNATEQEARIIAAQAQLRGLTPPPSLLPEDWNAGNLATLQTERANAFGVTDLNRKLAGPNRTWEATLPSGEQVMQGSVRQIDPKTLLSSIPFRRELQTNPEKAKRFYEATTGIPFDTAMETSTLRAKELSERRENLLTPLASKIALGEIYQKEDGGWYEMVDKFGQKTEAQIQDPTRIQMLSQANQEFLGDYAEAAKRQEMAQLQAEVARRQAATAGSSVTPTGSPVPAGPAAWETGQSPAGVALRSAADATVPFLRNQVLTPLQETGAGFLDVLSLQAPQAWAQRGFEKFMATKPENRSATPFQDRIKAANRAILTAQTRQ